uniref:Uncharacterized protein n=1 Tax=Solanum lycopersicum TaxID=4081 RepID=A0A3Q7I286_SOLLC
MFILLCVVVVFPNLKEILIKLSKEFKKGCAFDGWSEGTLNFPLTYKEFAQTHENAQHLSDADWSRQLIEWFKDQVQDEITVD